MEISDVRRRLNETIDRARREAADRRVRGDDASRDYVRFLESEAIPVFRQVADVLRVQGYPFGVFTPGGSVRLMSEAHADDFIELSLDTAGERPLVLGHISRRRGSRVIEVERPIADSPVGELTEHHVLEFLLKELEPFVER